MAMDEKKKKVLGILAVLTVAGVVIAVAVKDGGVELHLRAAPAGPNIH